MRIDINNDKVSSFYPNERARGLLSADEIRTARVPRYRLVREYSQMQLIDRIFID